MNEALAPSGGGGVCQGLEEEQKTPSGGTLFRRAPVVHKRQTHPD
jgi:hypothetical protein